MLGWDLHLRAAGGDVRTGRVAVAERPVTCRRRRDAAAATRDDAVLASKWWSAGDGGAPTPPAKSVATCRSASVRPPQTRCRSPSLLSTICPECCGLVVDLLLICISGRPGKHEQRMTNAFAYDILARRQRSR